MPSDMYTICYVDDNETEMADFVGEMQVYFNVLEVTANDEESLSDLVERLRLLEFDYLVVDYHLNQDARVDFDGDAVIAGFTSIFKDFPYMLLSSDGRGAVLDSEGVSAEQVRDKSEVFDASNQELVVGRITKAIDQYKNRLNHADLRYKELRTKKDTEGLTLAEEKEATELNSILDNSLDASSSLIPIDITNGDRLTQLIEKTDDLISKLQQQ